MSCNATWISCSAMAMMQVLIVEWTRRFPHPPFQASINSGSWSSSWVFSPAKETIVPCFRSWIGSSPRHLIHRLRLPLRGSDQRSSLPAPAPRMTRAPVRLVARSTRQASTPVSLPVSDEVADHLSLSRDGWLTGRGVNVESVGMRIESRKRAKRRERRGDWGGYFACSRTRKAAPAPCSSSRAWSVGPAKGRRNWCWGIRRRFFA